MAGIVSDHDRRRALRAADGADREGERTGEDPERGDGDFDHRPNLARASEPLAFRAA
jgi:hypothetical protein